MDLKTIFSQGKKEWKRRRSISQDSGSLKSTQKQLEVQLSALGQKAWGERIDISAHPEIRTILETNQNQLDELGKKSQDCRNRKEEKEAGKNRENEQFNKERKGIEERKKEADSRLSGEKDILKKLQKELNQSEQRSGQIAGEREQLQKKITSPEATVEQRSEIEKKLQQLAQEESALLDRRRELGLSVKTQGEKVAPLQTEADELQKQINAVQERQKESISAIDKELAEIKKEFDTHQSRIQEIEKTQLENYRLLGEKLAAGGTLPVTLDDEIAAVRESEQKISEIKAKLADLDSQQSEEGRSAYRKMLTILIGGVLLLIALIVLGVILLSPKDKPQSIVEELSQGKINEAVGGMMALAGAEKAKEIQKGLENMQEGVEAIRKASQEKMGRGETVASEEKLSSALPQVPNWQMSAPIYSRMNFSGIDTASLRTTYQDDSGRTVAAEITDTHSVSVLLAPSQALLMSGMTVDDEQIYQKSGKLHDHPMIESLDKQDKTARLTLIVKERYLLNLETSAEEGIELLKTFAGRMKLDELDG